MTQNCSCSWALLCIYPFRWHVQNATFPCCSQELLPFLSVMYSFLPTPLHQLFFHPPSPHLAVYFLVYLSVLLFPDLYIIRFWEFYFLPFSLHAQTNVTYLTLKYSHPVRKKKGRGRRAVPCHDLRSSGRNLFVVSYVPSLKSNLCWVLTT